jgi:hypothetical protein
MTGRPTEIALADASGFLFPHRATSSQRVSPWQFATSADPSPLLRNEPAIGEGMSNVKIPMSKRKRKAELIPRGPAAQRRNMKHAEFQNISRSTLFPSKTLGFGLNLTT